MGEDAEQVEIGERREEDDKKLVGDEGDAGDSKGEGKNKEEGDADNGEAGRVTQRVKIEGVEEMNCCTPF